ncbi:MAG: helix-turn-helix transcriptional regulator [Ktedonobacteraceae bacterium]|nr:helix-turn-helix transcriptional regulator [Ktedonobacteraceae bacterium]
MAKIRLRVKEVAEARGMSMTMLSHKSYVSLNTIRAIFRHPYHIVKTETLERLAAALEVPILDLVEEVPDQEVSDEEESEE